MDSITQGLLGAVTAQLGFRRRIGRDASWVAALAAWSPDWDVFVPADGFTRWLIHRGPTHSLLMVPIIAAVFALPWWAIRRKLAARARKGQAPDAAGSSERTCGNPRSLPPPFVLLYACCFVAVLTHGLLDWCTSYGTQILWPITSTRYAIDTVGIVDIIYSPILILTLLTCYVLRKVRTGGAPRAALVAGWVGFLLSVAYLSAGWGMNRWAVAKARRHLGDVRIVSARAYPMVGTILLWRVVVRTDDGWGVVRIHHLAGSDSPPRSASAAEAKDNEWISRARRTREFEIFRWFAMGQVRTEYESAAGRHVVRFHDMRYARGADSPDSLWPIVVTFDESGKIAAITRRHNQPVGRDRKALIAAMWKDMWNP